MDPSLIAPGIVTTVLLVVLGYVGWLAARFKEGISAQKEVVDTLRSHLGYVSDLHATVSKLYEPAELQKVLQVKVDSAKQEFERRLSGLQMDLDLKNKGVRNLTEIFFEMISNTQAYNAFVIMTMARVPKHVVRKISQGYSGR